MDPQLKFQLVILSSILNEVTRVTSISCYVIFKILAKLPGDRATGNVGKALKSFSVKMYFV